MRYLIILLCFSVTGFAQVEQENDSLKKVVDKKKEEIIDLIIKAKEKTNRRELNRRELRQIKETIPVTLNPELSSSTDSIIVVKQKKKIGFLQRIFSNETMVFIVVGAVAFIIIILIVK